MEPGKMNFGKAIGPLWSTQCIQKWVHLVYPR